MRRWAACCAVSAKKEPGLLAPAVLAASKRRTETLSHHRAATPPQGGLPVRLAPARLALVSEGADFLLLFLVACLVAHCRLERELDVFGGDRLTIVP